MGEIKLFKASNQWDIIIYDTKTIAFKMHY